MNKVLENYSIDTLIDNAYDMCDECPSVNELQVAIAADIDGCPEGPFSDTDVDEVLCQTYQIVREEVQHYV